MVPRSQGPGIAGYRGTYPPQVVRWQPEGLIPGRGKNIDQQDHAQYRTVWTIRIR